MAEVTKLHQGSERGAAKIHIILEDGEIEVTHGTQPDLTLLKAIVDDGFWDALWEHIERSARRVTYRYRDEPDDLD